MFITLRNKLILLYSISTGFILIIVLIILLMFTERELKAKRLETFQNNTNTIIYKLQSENIIKHSWLSQLEEENNLIIHIEDNGYPLKFPGVLIVPTDRNNLIEQLAALALEEGIDVRRNPVFFSVEKSSIYTIKGTRGDIYYSCAVIIPTNSGWRSLLLLEYIPNYNSSLLNQRILFSILVLSGLLALFTVSYCFVTRMLKPMEENNLKQTSFIAAASHELRSPLSVISANKTAISDASPQSQIFLTGIEKECKRMARLIDDMLILASIDSKAWIIKNKKIETDTLLVETYEAYYHLFQIKERTLLLDLPEDELPVIYADKERIQQLLATLLDNSLSYTPIHSNIILRGYALDNYFTLEVEDHGIGIADKDKKLIFDRFYRVDQSRNDKQHFGLGLSIAKDLVHLQGGNISVRDTSGGGATFVVRFKVHNQ